MIVSYETFRVHADKFQAEGTCDLLICDEAHRLKNDQTLTNKVEFRALSQIAQMLHSVYYQQPCCNPVMIATAMKGEHMMVLRAGWKMLNFQALS